MAFVFEKEERKVIPNWRPFEQTISSGELDSQLINVEPCVQFPIDEYINDWLDNQSLSFAGDLVGAAITNGFENNPHVLDAVTFIKSSENIATSSQLEVAEGVTYLPILKSIDCNLKDLREISFDCIATKNDIQKKIHDLRNKIRQYPLNPILYVEMSRWFVHLGLENQAKKAIDIAVHLAPNNRFVIRSAVRLYTHFDELDYAHYLLRKTSLTKVDPWLMAAEISVNSLREKTSQNIKRGIELINSKKHTLNSITELSSAIGTIEFINGANKKSRNLFNISLESPNDNSLAQAEWAYSHSLGIVINKDNYKNVKYDSEAKTLYCIQSEKYEEAVLHSIDWISDMQFSKRPIIEGSHIAYTNLKNYTVAAKILEIGIMSNPKDAQLWNNLTYSYALDNNLEEAQRCIAFIDNINKVEIDEKTEICLNATKGLVAFRQKNYEKGRGLYKLATNMAYDIRKDDPTFYWSAILNYVREELLITNKYDSNLMNEINKVKEGPNNKDITLLKNEVIALNDRWK